MNIKVDFNAGTSFKDACQQAKDFAIKMNLRFTRFDFNGISCSISQRCDVEEVYEDFLKALQRSSEFKFVIK
jgi:hypothetical protein